MSEDKNQSITVEQLDEMFFWVMNPRKAKHAWIIHLIKLVAVYLYLFSRSKLVEESWRQEKNEYMKKQILENRDEINSRI